ncbi:hypothetical protein C457_13449 [Haloferax prahovense DSM 18310]|uniref:Uncharacterized protein n=1 Tax=Haloferax prahovense (strain DSM 18310 / JCM 13924 / TL6) TaxID=1227461 RepID=M0G4F2_HALPT|nr:hypothetical protein [Haloferax prahovense]ELZ67045.1 hypothetical protein C457_13449 [Haloferax prahovense DSM 18310]
MPYYGAASNVDRPNHWVAPDDVDDDEYPTEVELSDWSVIEVRDREMHELLDECHTKWTDRDIYEEKYGHLDDDCGEVFEIEEATWDGFVAGGVDPGWGDSSDSQD